MLKRLLRDRRVQTALGAAFAAHVRFVRATSTLVLDPPDLYPRFEPDQPVIIAMWHGEHFLLPLVKRDGHRVKTLISIHRDGEINAIAAQRLGIGLVRGSGSHGGQNVDKRGAAAFLEMTRALAEGWNMALTADVPKVARVAGAGIVTLARKSGRPIYPVAVVTSRHRVVESSWDRSKIPLPFGRIVVSVGDVLRVPADADAAAVETARRTLTAALDAVHERAYALAAGGARRP
jgi:hypothetical protein